MSVLNVSFGVWFLANVSRVRWFILKWRTIFFSVALSLPWHYASPSHYWRGVSVWIGQMMQPCIGAVTVQFEFLTKCCQFYFRHKCLCIFVGCAGKRCGFDIGHPRDHCVACNYGDRFFPRYSIFPDVQQSDAIPAICTQFLIVSDGDGG